MNEFEADLGDIRRDKLINEQTPIQHPYYQGAMEYRIPQETNTFKENFILSFVIISIIAVFVFFGIFLNQVSKDKFKSMTDVEQKVEPKIDVYSNSTTNNQFNITSPIVNYFNITLVNNIYLNWTGNNS